MSARLKGSLTCWPPTCTRNLLSWSPSRRMIAVPVTLTTCPLRRSATIRYSAHKARGAMTVAMIPGPAIHRVSAAKTNHQAIVAKNHAHPSEHRGSRAGAQLEALVSADPPGPVRLDGPRIERYPLPFKHLLDLRPAVREPSSVSPLQELGSAR